MNAAILIGALIGFFAAHWGGLVIGALAGYFLPKFFQSKLHATVRRIQAPFVESTFAVMGAVCKADGRVSEEEIHVAEAFFDRFHLHGEMRSMAVRAFNRGKQPGFDLDAEVAAFARASRGQRALHLIFLQVQLSALAADGAIHPAEHELLLRIARGLGLSAEEVRRLEAMLRGGGAARSSQENLDDAYAVLGIHATASDIEVKKAYRRLMSENHPDKLAARGLPESMREMAEERTREITRAYRRIEEARSHA